VRILGSYSGGYEEFCLLELMTEILAMTDPRTGTIDATLSQRVKQIIGSLCYHNLTQQHYDFIC
jgi:hypothetical protein